MPATLDGIISVSITANTANPTAAGFGTPGLVAYVPTSVFPERVREYSSLTGMTDDGHLTNDGAYLMAAALKAQNPSVTSWKVLRRALAPVQTMTLTPTITTEGEVLSFTLNGTEISYTILAAATINSIATALTALCNAVTGVTAVDATGSVTITPKNVATATLTVDGVVNNEVYTVTIDGTDFAFTSDASATATEIRDGLQALIIAGGYAAAEVVDNGADALDFSFASHAGADLRESTATTGTMALSAEVLATGRLVTIGGLSTGLTIIDLTPDPGVATDWAAIIAEDNDFYGVGLDSSSEVQIKALAALVETETKIYSASCINSEIAVAATTDDVLSDLEALAYDRTALLFGNFSGQYGGCRWLGKMLPKAPGSATWAYQTLSGLTYSNLTEAQVAAIEGKTGNHYTRINGLNLTQTGVAVSGEFLDITMGIDWLTARIQEGWLAILANADKVGYSEVGALVEALIREKLDDGRRNKLISPDTTDTPWVVTTLARADVTAASKAARDYPGTEFSAYLEGAVHTAQIVGTLTP